MAGGGRPPVVHSTRAGSAPPLPHGPSARAVKSPHPDGGGSHLHPAGRSTMTAGRLGALVAPLFLGLVLLGCPLGTGAWIRARTDAWKTEPTTPGAEAAKTGVCPKLEKDLNCTLECSSDGECADNLKCCPAGCARVCHLPDEKPGSCPKVDLPLTPLGLCRNQCQVDSQCPDQMKCCRNGCGKVSCLTPVF